MQTKMLTTLQKKLRFLMKNITPVILCGGVGSRLWPISRKNMLRQFAELLGIVSLVGLGDNSMIFFNA
jgi:hypothetical protein